LLGGCFIIDLLTLEYQIQTRIMASKHVTSQFDRKIRLWIRLRVKMHRGLWRCPPPC